MSGRVTRFLTENWTLKLAALGLALLLWLAVRAERPLRQPLRSVVVEVDVRDPDWRLAGPPEPQTVSLTVSGPPSALMALARTPPRIVLPVDDVADSVEYHVVPQRWIEWHGVNGIDLQAGPRPDTILLRFERITSRTLPVRITTVGALPDGYELSMPITSNPGAVEIRGPRREILGLDSVPLFPVDLSGIRNTTNVPTSVDTTFLSGFRITPSDINVILRVVPVDTVAAQLSPPRGAPY